MQDGLLAVSITLFQLLGTGLLAHNQPAAGRPGQPGYLLLAMGGLPLLVRRRWPVWVFITMAAVSLV